MPQRSKILHVHNLLNLCSFKLSLFSSVSGSDENPNEMEITEEERKRAESNRQAALAKRKALLESSIHQQQPQGPWKLFKCRKLSPELTSKQIPDTATIHSDPVPPARPPDKFRVRLEICSPDSFSATPNALQGFMYLGDDQCLQRLTDCLSNVCVFLNFPFSFSFSPRISFS